MNTVTNWCDGCLRTLGEIAAWGQMSDAQRRVVWQALPARAAAASRVGGVAPTPSPSPASSAP